MCLHNRFNKEDWLWQARLGHANFDTITTMGKQELVLSLPLVVRDNQLCESCLVGKQTHKPFSKGSRFRAKMSLDLIHGDLCRPTSPPTASGNGYIFVLIDD